jgi:hypothetical protein
MFIFLKNYFVKNMQVVRLCKIKQIIVLICGLLLASCELSGEKTGINKSKIHTKKGAKRWIL